VTKTGFRSFHQYWQHIPFFNTPFYSYKYNLFEKPNTKLTDVRALSHVRLSDLLGNFGFNECSKSVVVDRIHDSSITVCPIPEASLQDELLDWTIETG
jgi:hypothetical protein